MFAQTRGGDPPTSPTALERGTEDVKKFVMEYRSAFSDVENTAEDMIGEDDRVVTRWTLHVTHTGDFRVIPATGKRITITGIGIFRFSDEGKVVESWDSLDQLGVLRQLGVIPEPEDLEAWRVGQRPSFSGSCAAGRPSVRP